MKKVTLKDIANELNVSVGTVSHALNNRLDISDEMKEKVYKTVKKLGYISNASAVSLRLGKTNAVAIIVPDISNPHISHQIKLIESKLNQMNYSTIILNTDEDDSLEHDAIITACGRQVDGILICPSQHSTDNIEFLDKTGIPFVLIGRYFKKMNVDYVCSDDVKGGYLAAEYLIKKGFSNILYIGAYDYIEGSINRFDGICMCCRKHGISMTDERFIRLNPKSGGIFQQLSLLNENRIKFDSVIAFSDLLAFEIISFLKKLYHERDIPVVGFDAVQSHLFLPFEHISIGMVGDGWADKAITILLEKMGKSRKIYHELIDVEPYEFK